MKKSMAKRLAIFFTITLILSLIGIISYLSSNPAATRMYFTRDINYNNSYSKNYSGWLDFIPFMNDELKGFVQSEIDGAIHESIDMAKNQKNNWKDWSSNWKWSDDSTMYTKVSDTIVDNFSSNNIDTIEILTDVSKLRFVEEDRSDIKVEYSYTKPDTKSFSLSYDKEVKNNTLFIEQHIKMRNFSGSMKKFKNDITVYVPKGFRVDKLTYHNNLGEIIDNEFYSKVKDLDLFASLGKIDISLSENNDSVKLSASMGDITLDNSANIDDLSILANGGSIRLDNAGKVNTLIMDADMGEITVDADGIVNTCTLDANMGNIDAIFKKEIDAFNINCDMGNIDLTLYDNDNTTIDTKVSMGKVSSDFAEGSSESYVAKCDMGNITVKKK